MQIYFDNDRYKVFAGWDAPLEGFFLDIHAVPEKVDEDPAEVWLSIDHWECCGMTTEISDVFGTLQSHGVCPPMGFRSILERREGNVVYVWDNEQWIKR